MLWATGRDGGTWGTCFGTAFCGSVNSAGRWPLCRVTPVPRQSVWSASQCTGKLVASLVFSQAVLRTLDTHFEDPRFKGEKTGCVLESSIGLMGKREPKVTRCLLLDTDGGSSAF